MVNNSFSSYVYHVLSDRIIIYHVNEFTRTTCTIASLSRHMCDHFRLEKASGYRSMNFGKVNRTNDQLKAAQVQQETLGVHLPLQSHLFTLNQCNCESCLATKRASNVHCTG